MRIATFNVQNLRLRQRASQFVLDGAVDRDMPEFGRSDALDAADRRRTARVIRDANADVVALQEVFDLATLDYFHDHCLLPAGAAPYPYRHCLPGNDGSGLNVAALGRIEPLRIESHARLTAEELALDDVPDELKGTPLFRRDCLRLDYEALTLFICHFKAPYPDVERAWAVRRAEAEGVRAIVERAFDKPAQSRWIVLGDFNEPVRDPDSGPSAIAPLKDGFTVDLADRLRDATPWTYETPDTHLHSRPDRILVSPRLATEYPGAVPRIIRARGDTHARPHASDHALVFADFPGLTKV